MKKYRMKVLSIVPIFVVLILAVGIIIAWQYFEYKKESDYYQLQIRLYEQFYLKDRNKLEDKTVGDIQELITQADNKIKKCSRVLPDSSYMSLYGFIGGIGRLFDSCDVQFEITDIEAYKKDFYEEIDYSLAITGKSQNIFKCIEHMLANNKLIQINEVCLPHGKNDNLSNLNLNFKTFMFIGPRKWAGKKTQKEKPIEQRGINTWLPPLSGWAAAYRDRALELKQLEITKKDMKQKLDLFRTYKSRLKKLSQLEIIIKHLGDPGRKQDVSIDNVTHCKDA